MDATTSQIHRLRMMVEPGQTYWDLSSKDVEAIQLAVDVLEAISTLDSPHCAIVDVQQRLGLSVESRAVTLSFDD